MIESLQAFIEDLRGRGVAVSPAEAVDAARAVAIVGPEDRARFRTALAMTLAKDRRSLSIFDDAFEGFFLPPARGRRGGERGGEGGASAGLGGPGHSGAAGAGIVSRPGTIEETEETEPGRERTSHPGPPRPARAGAASLRQVHPQEIRRQLARTTTTGSPRSSGNGRGAERDTRSARAEMPRPGAVRAKERHVPHGDEPGPPAAKRPRLTRLLAAEASRATETTPGASARDPRPRNLAAPMTTAEETA